MSGNESDLEAIKLTFVLDMPHGVNKLYKPIRTKSGARMIKNDGAREWAHRAKYEVELQRAGASLPYRFTMLIVLPETSFDTDAPVKEILDACQHGGAVRNDRYLRGFCVHVDDTRPTNSVLIELTDTGERIPDHRKFGTKEKKDLAQTSLL